MKPSTTNNLISYFKKPLIIFFIVSTTILVVDNTLFYDKQSNKVVVSQDNLRKFVNVKYGLDNMEMINRYIDSLDKDKKDFLVNEYLINEALYNFAINRSLDKNDEELKSVITAKSQNVIEMMVNAEQPLPTIDEARNFFEKGDHDYNKQETYDLVIINKLKNDPSLTVTLREQDPSLRQLVQMSDVMNFDKVIRDSEKKQLQELFGLKQSVELLSYNDDVWSGPYTTDSGYHWVKKQTHPANTPQFDQIKDRVIADLYQQKIDERYQAIIQDLIGQLNVRSEV